MNGTTVILLVNTGTPTIPIYTAVGSQRDVSFEESTAEIDLSSKNAREQTVGAGRYSANLTLDNLYVESDAGYEALKDAMRNEELILVAKQVDDVTTETANALVTSLSERNPDQGEATVTCSLTINDGWTEEAETAIVYGVSWDLSDSPTLTRTDDSVGFTAEAGVDGSVVTNDFDTAEIYKDIIEVEDVLGNAFVRIPKFYIKKTKSAVTRTWQISNVQGAGYYLPACFYDYENEEELPYIYVGKHLGYVDAGVLQSIPDVYPTVNTNIVDFRTAAEANNTGGLLGYQQMDIHTYDALTTLFYIEFATLNSQSIMRGYADGRYTDTDLLTADTSPAGNTLVVSNAVGANYKVGQAISVGTTLGGNQRFYGRTITAIDADTPSSGSTTITFDGDAVELFIGDILYNTAMKTGFSSKVAASSGSISSNSDGKHSFSYRGIESLYGDIFQFVDGVNINDLRAWICRDANDYASNLFASPYEELSYINGNADGYISEMGFDSDNPFAAFPTSIIGGENNKYYSDYYYQATGQRVALVGGSWRSGSYAGLSYWNLRDASSSAHVSLGARLLKKAL